MSEKPISPLRQRMLEDMSVRRFAPDTQRESTVPNCIPRPWRRDFRAAPSTLFSAFATD